MDSAVEVSDKVIRRDSFRSEKDMIFSDEVSSPLRGSRIFDALIDLNLRLWEKNIYIAWTFNHIFGMVYFSAVQPIRHVCRLAVKMCLMTQLFIFNN